LINLICFQRDPKIKERPSRQQLLLGFQNRNAQIQLNSFTHLCWISC
uniref:Protein kinase domain-containing protein n=1 Tax=Haemonchus placei TaxID=6290 RepID=A0A0N4VTW2_HAEPC